MTDAETADALDRRDELGEMVLTAFSFAIPPFGESFAGGAREDR